MSSLYQGQVRGSIEAWRLEGELYATVREELDAIVTERWTGAVAKELLESIACVTGYADTRVQVEAFELCVVTHRFVEPLRARVFADRDRGMTTALAEGGATLH